MNTLVALDAWYCRAASALPFDQPATIWDKGGDDLLTLPVLVLGVVVATFVFGVRAVRNASKAARQPPHAGWRAAGSRTALWGLIGIGLLLWGLLVCRLEGSLGIDVLLALLVVCMLGLIVAIRNAARSQPLSRGQVASMIGNHWYFLLLPFIFGSTPLNPDSDIGTSVSGLVMLTGTAILQIVGRRPGASALAGVVSGVAMLFLAGLVLERTRAAPSDLREFLSSSQPQPQDLAGWEEHAATYEALRAIGEPVPDVAATQAAVASAIDQGVAAHPAVWTAAARMGLIDAEHWRKLASREREARARSGWLEPTGPRSMTDYDEYQLPLLLATTALTSKERECVTTRIAALWPTEGEYGQLGDAALCVRLFDLVGAGDHVDQRRAEVHELLRQHWVWPSASFSPGGFTSDPSKFNSSFAEETALAVELMVRLGVPDGIDLRVVRAYLRHESRAHWPLSEATYGRLTAPARAALLRLDRQIGLPPRSLSARVLGERLLIGSVLLVALCFIAVAVAPRGQAAVRAAPGQRPKLDADRTTP